MILIAVRQEVNTLDKHVVVHEQQLLTSTLVDIGIHKDLSTLKSDIRCGLAASVSITFSGR